MDIFIKKPFLIGEIGVNFYDIAEKEGISDMDAAKLMIDEAKSCGIDAVKFQTYKAETIASRNSPAYWDLSEEPTTSQFELFKKFDKFGVEEYRQLAQYCNEVGITFLSTPFDFESVDYLDEFLDVYKISSSDLTNIPFIKYIAGKNKPIMISTGASTLKEIKNAVAAIEEVSEVDIAIMHCVLSYPTSFEDANLLMIKDLAEHFPDYEIGYSDHTKPDENMMVLTTAYNYGANIIEKHFTLDKTLKGNDHYHAMDPSDVIKFKNNVKFISKINGRKNKQPLICESSARKEARRSVVALRDIKKGELISMENVTFKRPGTGISPADIDNVRGRKAIEDISEDTLISYEMLS
ncbi:acetylneuraminic acid synthetase [Methanobrevibacter sp. YE315]|uniref:N-acetylneuraminate synthase family protein n=1 Tax=Methanobrevibacter sp. YE315 TaxID=1609968 RepID=UPI000764EA2A|nr:N-acetylneuraminate synthase family protein [Methanobrevibacter sp. YE315]AMD18130.1 acetylneuraminic acid synthetase [Methanobrevibacter sp. YE315]